MDVVMCNMGVVINTEYGEGIVSKYTCCGERRESPGCQVAKVSFTTTILCTMYMYKFFWLLFVETIVSFYSKEHTTVEQQNVYYCSAPELYSHSAYGSF